MMEKLEEAWSYLEDYEYRDYFPQYTDNPKDIWTFPNRELLKSNLNGLKTMLPSIDQSLHYAAAYLYYADSAYDKWSLTDKNGNATDHTILTITSIVPTHIFILERRKYNYANICKT